MYSTLFDAMPTPTVPAQSVTCAQLNGVVRDGDVLFIDSTHTVKTGSDCLHIYLRLLPNITASVYVHAHDVFLPYPMPKRWLLESQWYWTEQYLLMAYLLDNKRIETLYGSMYNRRFNGDLMEQLMGGKHPPGGCSFWFHYRGA